MADTTRRHNSSLKVSIRPLQSSFFAGEDFICQITFTNTNPKVAHTQPLSQREFPLSPTKPSHIHHDSHLRPSLQDKSHRRVVSSLPVHSKSRSVDLRALGRHDQISSSPSLSGSTRTHNLLRHLNGELLPERRNLIGKNMSSPSGSHFIHPWSVSSNLGSSKPSHRSTQSTSIPYRKNQFDLGLGRPTLPESTPPTLVGAISEPPRFSPNPPSRISSLPGLNTNRTLSAPISPNHSHSRKKSVAQVQAEDLTEAFELDSPSTSAPPTPTAIASSSWRINEPDASASFYAMGRNDTMESVFRESVTDWSQSRRRPSIARSPGHSPIYPLPDSLAPGTEKILWSFAQIGGTIEIDESLIKPCDFENLKRRLAYGDLTGASASPHSVPGTPRTLGGGDLGQSSDEKAAASGWSSYLRGPFGGRSREHRRIGSTLQDAQERTLQSRSVPTFSTPPSIVAVDLLLLPGESKTYQFKLRLPIDLPPSYHGKAIRLKYVLTLGTNRFDVYAATTKAQTSRLIQIPIRVYNNVGASGFRPFFDLMNPVILTKEKASVSVVGDHDKVAATATSVASTPQERRRAKISTKVTPKIQRKDLQDFTKQLLISKQSTDESQSPIIPEFGISTAPTHSRNTCKAAVEALARSSSKVSYDISKEGKVAAVLTLVRSRYRLGETITGVININNLSSLARIARMSATLETFEEVQPSIATLPPGRLQRATRIVHAEHHESVLDKGRASFSLCIPSGASPEFVTSGVKLNWLVRLSFLTVSATKAATEKKEAEKEGMNKLLPPPHLLPGSSDGFTRYHVSVRALDNLAGSATGSNTAAGKVLAQLGYAKETKLETVECAVPVSILPNSTSYKVGDAEFYA
ncbi:uncharacterized protein MEPE_04624 [Melanopsichium pennsylvanicum]|uniref:Rgp1-domain-containing protein n=2 Tax=Melanopsichium pennsylvanicum TaxID=63383 RepID=A0AAJ4XP50_9BASI|nr:conserved hypothetical protein [Melanopsichium pennsylvanicum 4]SNX85915.1 uncharacterized protein MEPE_04624 [Melanopsichium pennsylvanicum]